MSSAAPAAPATAPAAAPTGFGNNRGIRFNIKTGTKTWACTLQDRSTYERTKAALEASSTPVDSETSSTTSKSA